LSAAPLYLETSALLRVLFRQRPYAGILERIAAAERLVTSRLTRIESARALLRAAREPGVEPAAAARAEQDVARLFDRVALLEISPEVAALAERVAPGSPLRSLDAIHLATWQLARGYEPGLELLTSDLRLATAAGIEPALS